jgi:hypothetical protein
MSVAADIVRAVVWGGWATKQGRALLPAKIQIDKTVKVDGLEITESSVVDAFAAAQAEGKSTEDYLLNIISLGSRVLAMANAGAGVQQLADGIEQTGKAMKAASARLTEEITKKVDEVTGEDGNLAKALQAQIGEFGLKLEKLTGDEDSPIRTGLKKQVDEMARVLVNDLARQSLITKNEILGKLNPTSEGSPFAIFSHELDTVKRGLEAITNVLSENKGRELEAKKGTDKGRTFEKQVMEVLSIIAAGSGDDAEHTGDILGKFGKMGDGVVTVRAGLQRVTRIAVEAKDKKLSEEKWHAEATGAMKNRDAMGFLGVCKNIEDMPNKQRLYPLDNLGQRLVVCFDPEQANDKDFLALVYQVVKMHTLSSVSNGDQVNVQALSLYVEQSIKQLDRLAKFSTYAKNIKREADKIISEQDEISDDLTQHLKAIRREIIGVETMALIESSSVLAIEDQQS